MTGIFFSTANEAGPFLTGYYRGRFDGLSEGESAQDDQVLIALTGVGKIKATLRTERLLRSNTLTRLIHIGTCTALDSETETGTLFAIEKILEGDRIELAAPAYPRMPLATPFDGLPKATLVTQDHTLNTEEQSYWQRIATVSDTVGYPIAFVAATYGIPCIQLKVVAGHAGKQDTNLRRTLASAYEKMAAFLLEEVVSG